MELLPMVVATMFAVISEDDHEATEAGGCPSGLENLGGLLWVLFCIIFTESWFNNIPIFIF